MRRAWTLIAAAGLLLAAPAGAQEAPPAPQLVSMQTAAVSGVYFPVGVALCRLVNQHRRDTGVRCAARPSGGSVANVATLRDGAAALALVQSDTQAQALAGSGAFATAGPFADLRAVMSLYPETLTLVARADAGIARVEDLPGKRVWLGEEGSGTRVLAGDLMAALGWTADSFAPVAVGGPTQMVQALCAGDLDAFFYAVGHPALVIQEATTGCPVQLVPVDGPAIDALVDAHPELVRAEVPGGLYRGVRDPVPSFGVSATLVTRADQPEALVHAMVGQIFADFDMLRGLEPTLASLDPEAMATEGLTAPLHPGAERYFRERGWID